MSWMFLTSFAALLACAQCMLPYMQEKYEPIYARPCRKQDKECVFTLVVTEKLTMVYERSLLYTYNGKLYKWNVNPTDPGAQPVDPANVVVSDGFPKPIRVLCFNDTVPGPTIEAWEGQKLIINVHNQDISEAVTVHWHGLHQRNSGWYDGIPWLTQCPQHPGEIFTQRMTAYPAGTMWYHSHVGLQLSDALYGALVIHHTRHKEAACAGDYTVQFADVNHDVIGNQWYLYLVNGVWRHLAAKYGDPELAQRYHSLTINGRARYISNTGVFLTFSPLTEYPVIRGKWYRFRVIASQASTFVKFSIDNHRLKIVATDGRDCEPFWATHVMLLPGERFDVLVLADQPVGNYWVRGYNGKQGLAIMRYAGASPTADPTSTGIPCLANATCTIVNCDVPDFAIPNTRCLTVAALKSRRPNVPGLKTPSARIREHFFNFGFKRGPRVNGNRYRVPVSPILTQPNEPQENPCYTACKSYNVCECTYSHHMKLGDIQQFIFLSKGQGASSHPIHMHGHHFFVVKVGLPKMNASGHMIGENEDIVCDEPMYCNQPRWRNRKWRGNNIPGLNLKNPPLKDTVNAPRGGYVIVRFKSDNPGAWGMHCHIEPHLNAGMFVALIEGIHHFDRFDIPSKFPTCRHFTPHRYRPKSDMDYYGFSSEHDNNRYRDEVVYGGDRRNNRDDNYK